MFHTSDSRVVWVGNFDAGPAMFLPKTLPGEAKLMHRSRSRWLAWMFQSFQRKKKMQPMDAVQKVNIAVECDTCYPICKVLKWFGRAFETFQKMCSFLDCN